ncbi:MAG: hypothetical protein ACNS60_10730 [Candidatus Cyclobacteriaceae bacterium M2_1C_046]
MKTRKYNLTHLLNNARQALFILFFLVSTQIYAQEETNPKNFGIHAGVNSGLWDNVSGPSFSFHYAFQTEKVVQLESMLFFDSQSGRAALSGKSQKNSGLGLAAGIRFNILPQKNWNPSFVIMPGLIYSSETQADYRRSGISGSLFLAFSNTFYRRHMLSIGVNRGENILLGYLKYGFWF